LRLIVTQSEEAWMAKTIIFCADGTWNGPEQQTGVSAIEGNDEHGELTKSNVTNVVKLFANLAGRVTPQTLALQNEQEKVLVNADGTIGQVAKYMHGVGASNNLLIKLLGGTLGVGVITRIVRGYTFISRHYLPGDEIHIIGFSRGAYTARALAGMIAKVGLLNPHAYNPDDRQEAYRLGIAAWCKSKGVTLQGAGKLSAVATTFLNFVQSFFASQLSADALIANVKIKSVAVWDTVGSLGIPVYAADGRYDVFRFTDTALSAQVENGFHAMAIDELRIDFPVTRWDQRDGVRQVWFAGAHADVGGGYPVAESGLSDIALDWMMQQLTGVGTRFATPLTYQANACFDQKIHEPWSNPPFAVLKRTPRQVLPDDPVHETALKRWKELATYRPDSMAAWAQKKV
jgi:uncharacterized protein (DUF2235 family)